MAVIWWEEINWRTAGRPKIKNKKKQNKKRNGLLLCAWGEIASTIVRWQVEHSELIWLNSIWRCTKNKNIFFCTLQNFISFDTHNDMIDFKDITTVENYTRKIEGPPKHTHTHTHIYIYIYIRLKIKPNSVRIRF